MQIAAKPTPVRGYQDQNDRPFSTVDRLRSDGSGLIGRVPPLIAGFTRTAAGQPDRAA